LIPDSDLSPVTVDPSRLFHRSAFIVHNYRMTPAGKLLAAEARGRFEALAAQPEASVDLAHAALLIAAEERPGTDVDHYRARLLSLGMAARARVALDPDSPVAALNNFVFGELGFAGNQQNYYDPRNSLLSYVLDERRGIPVTLSVVYMELGRRAGLEVEGVGLPGHFVVRATAQVTDGVESVLIDPFNARVISEDECQELLDSAYAGQVTLADGQLRLSTREILARVLRNLKGVYAQGRRYARALAAVERILLLEPDAADERRDRAALLFQLGRYAEAAADFEKYLAAAPRASDAALVREQHKKALSKSAGLN
jgi:regulator of sirC expression with transglutaminase-like and TPR domain